MKEENRSGHINIWCVCWLDVRAPQWWEPSSVFIGEPERSEERERQVLSLLPTITFLRQLFPAKCVRDEKALYWTSIFCTGKFGWHIEIKRAKTKLAAIKSDWEGEPQKWSSSPRLQRHFGRTTFNSRPDHGKTAKHRLGERANASQVKQEGG